MLLIAIDERIDDNHFIKIQGGDEKRTTWN